MKYECRYIEELSALQRASDLQVAQLCEVVTGGAPRLETRFRAGWTKDSLYLLYECEDDHVVSTMTRRDDPLYEEDVVEVFIDPWGGGKSYYEFEVSPQGMLFDALIHNTLDGYIDVDTTWMSPGFRAEVTETAEGGRSYLVQIPFADLNIEEMPQNGTVWHWNVFRIDDDPEGERHYWAWSPTGKVNFHIPQAFGELVFIK